MTDGAIKPAIHGRNIKCLEKIMKKIYLIFFICLLIFSGCGDADQKREKVQSKKIDNLILSQELINKVSAILNQDGIPIWSFNKRNEIDDILQIIRDIPVEELTKEKDIEFMQNGRKLVQEGILSVYFFLNEKTLGKFLIWPDGRIYVVDIESANGRERTISYLSNKSYPEIYESLKNK